MQNPKITVNILVYFFLVSLLCTHIHNFLHHWNHIVHTILYNFYSNIFPTCLIMLLKYFKWQNYLLRGQQIFYLKSYIATILGFPGPIISVTTSQFCHCSTKAIMDKMQTKEHDYAIKLYLQKQAAIRSVIKWQTTQ